MNKIATWLYIIGAVVIALAANSISAIWASKNNKFFSPWLIVVILISPLVFITFGLVTSKIGLSSTSATVDALLTISTILVGLFLFNEWESLSWYQLLGVALSFVGIILMQLHK